MKWDPKVKRQSDIYIFLFNLWISPNNLNYRNDKLHPAGTRRPGDVPCRSPKGPNIRDLQGTYRGLLGDQQKKW